MSGLSPSPQPLTSNLSPKRSTTVGIVFLVLFLDLVSFGLVFPVFGQMLDYYLERDSGLLRWMMQLASTVVPAADHGQRAALFGGMLAALYSLLQFVTAPWWGRLSDRIGRRPVLLWSLVGSLAANLLWVFSADFTVLLIARVIAGGFSGNVSTATAVVADITTPEQRGRAMGLMGMAFGLGFTVGPALGGVAWWIGHGWWSGGSAMFALNPFSLPALIATVLSLFNLAWVWRSFSETLPVERRSIPSGEGRSANPLRLFAAADLGAAVRRLNFSFAAYVLLFSGMEATLVFLAGQHLGLLPHHLGGLFMMIGLSSAMAQMLIFRRYVGRFGARRIGLAGLLTMMPGFLGLALVPQYPHLWLLVAALAVVALSSGMVFPALSTLVSLTADPQRQGQAMGTFRSAGSLGRAAGPLVAAGAYFSLSPSAPYLIAGIGVLLPVAMLALVKVSEPIVSPAGTR
ncbi:MFS transporter [Planctomycetota bacterium]|nr:MFS transporter [Planctomycetota bacterium]